MMKYIILTKKSLNMNCFEKVQKVTLIQIVYQSSVEIYKQLLNNSK